MLLANATKVLSRWVDLCQSGLGRGGLAPRKFFQQAFDDRVCVDAFCLRAEGRNDAVPEDRCGERVDIFQGDVESAMEQRAGFARHHDLLASSRSGSPLDALRYPFQRVGLFGPQRANHVQDILFDILWERDKPYDLLESQDLRTGDDRSYLPGSGSGGPFDDLALLLSRWIVHDGLKQESVALGFGQRIRSLLFDRILGRQNKKWFGQFVRLSSDGHRMLLHGLEQRGLRLGGSAIDFVREEDLRKDGTFCECELPVACLGLLNNVCSGNVRGHQVGCELNAMELEIHGLCKRSDHEGFGEPWHSFQKAMATRKHRDQELLDRFVLANDHLSYLTANFGKSILELFCLLEVFLVWGCDRLIHENPSSNEGKVP